MENCVGITEEYLTMDELCERIKYKKQTIYNKIYNGKLILKTHYLKPSPRKLLFKWSAMLEWIGDTTQSSKPIKKMHNDVRDTSTNIGNKNTKLKGCKIIV